MRKNNKILLLIFAAGLSFCAAAMVGYGGIWWVMSESIRVFYPDLPLESYNDAWNTIVHSKGGYVKVLWSTHLVVRLSIVFLIFVGVRAAMAAVADLKSNKNHSQDDKDPEPESNIKSLKKLVELKEAGVLTNEEFETQKKILFSKNST